MTIPELQALLKHRETLTPEVSLSLQRETHDVRIGALTLIGETRGESYDGRLAVAHTFQNRANDKHRRVIDVCLEPAQYSCWWGDDPNAVYVRSLAERLFFTKAPISPADQQLFTACSFLVRGVLRGLLPDNTNGATHYLTQSLLWTHPPTWTQGHAPCATIGRHVFFAGIPWN